MSTRKLTFPGADGQRLTARVSLPLDEQPRGWALFAHCFTCSKDLRAVNAISDALCAQGVAVFRFDFTGLGESEGEFVDTDFHSNVEDLLAASRFMEGTFQAPALLVGHSLGGAAALVAAASLPSVLAVATIGSPFDPAHVTHLFGDSLETIRSTGSAEVRIAGRPFTVSRDFLESVEEQSMERTLAELGRPLLVMHSPVDRTVGIENARRIYEAARHPKSFISLDDADHLLSDPADARYVGSVLASWADRYALAPRTDPDLDRLREGDRVTARTGSEGFRTDLLAGEHHWVADEPRRVGGDDTGPTPYDMLAAALASCTSMTLQMYARRKEWPLEEAIVRVRHTRVHGEDCAVDGQDPDHVDHLNREVEVRGDLTDDQRARLMEIAERCPVHRSIEGGILVRTAASPVPGAPGPT
ncbi:MAG: OsmC family protein [Gemmatimonadetes bacterium]|nr:OsmC family protein [Gemmatimonadota bacterium]